MNIKNEIDTLVQMIDENASLWKDFDDWDYFKDEVGSIRERLNNIKDHLDKCQQ